MITSLVILIIAMVVLMIMLFAVTSAILGFLVVSTGKGAVYDRTGNKMAKMKAKSSKPKKKAKAK